MSPSASHVQRRWTIADGLIMKSLADEGHGNISSSASAPTTMKTRSPAIPAEDESARYNGDSAPPELARASRDTAALNCASPTGRQPNEFSRTTAGSAVHRGGTTAGSAAH